MPRTLIINSKCVKLELMRLIINKYMYILVLYTFHKKCILFFLFVLAWYFEWVFGLIFWVSFWLGILSWLHVSQTFSVFLKGIYSFSFLQGSEVKAAAWNVGDLGLIPGLGRSPGEGNGNPLQYSCLENPMDGGA